MNEVTLGSYWSIGGVLYKVIAIQEEPNTGLVTLEEVTHPLCWTFVVPWRWLACDDKFRRQDV
jgi:hypothetical protein